MPAFTPLMLATFAKHAFSDPAWVFEAKLDGQRSLLWRRRATVRLITRNENDRTSHYPNLVEAVRHDDTAPLIADGEIVGIPRRRHLVLAPAGADAELETQRGAGRGRAGDLLPVRPDLVRWLRPLRVAAARAQVGTAPRDPFRGPDPLLRAP